MKKFKLNGNVNLYFFEADKFKTTSVSLFIYRKLGDDASLNALMAQVLKNTCEKYPTKQEMSKQLDMLCGASLNVSIQKKGDVQIIGFMAAAPCDVYTNESTGGKLAQLLYEIMFKPKFVNGSFDNKDVEIEKENLKNNILSVMNDKIQYARNRCIEEMCGKEPFGIYELGTAEKTQQITPQQLKRHYDEVVANSKIDVFVSGQCDIDAVKAVFEKVKSAESIPDTLISVRTEKVKTIEQSMDIKQGKLVVGMKTECEIKGKDFYAMALFNSVYGSGTHSKLFNNVREKLSLAYYATSRYYRQKGIIFVETGIEFENREKAENEILLQLDNMKNGQITNDEINQAKKSIINTYKSFADSPALMTEFYLGQFTAGDETELEEFIENIESVTVEDIIDAARKVKVDTVYFLKGE